MNNMQISWLVLVPVGIMLANPDIRRYLFPNNTHTNPPYMKAHYIVLGCAVCLEITALCIGLIIGNRKSQTHLILGLVASTAVIVVVGVGFWRTQVSGNSASEERTFQQQVRRNRLAIGLNHAHAWFGRIAWLVACINVFFGLSIARNYDYRYWITAIVFVVFSVFLLIFGVFFGQVLRKKQDLADRINEDER